MAKYTVDEFVIELGFNEKVIKGLQRVEKTAMAAATRIENRLNKAVTIDGNKSKAGFDKIVRNAQTAANSVNRAFSKSMDFGNAGKASVKGVETAARASAKRIKKEMQDAFNVRGNGRGGGSGGSGGGRPPRGGNGGGAGGSSNSAARSIERTYSNNYYSGLTRKLESMGVRGQGLAGKFRSDITGLRDEALKNPSANLANYNMQIKASIDSMKRWISAENAEAKARREQTWLLDRANSSLTQWIGGFASLYTVIEGIKKVVDAGVARQGQMLSAQAVFKGQAGDAKTFAAGFSQQIGQGFTETMKQYTGFAAGAQNALGYQGTQDFYKNAATFGRIRGLDAEQLKGIMVAFTQMASKGRVQAEELRGQLGDRLPGAEQMFADALGVNTQQLDALMKNGKLLAKDVLPRVSEQMKKMSDEVGGLDRVSQMAVTGIGRVNAAIENNLVKAFDGAESGLGVFTSALANMLSDSTAISEAMGGIFGEILKVAGSGIDHVDEWVRHISAALLRMSAWYDELDDGQKKLIKSAADFAIAVGEVLVVVKALRGVTGLISALLGIKQLAAGGAAAGAGAAAGSSGAGAAGGGIMARILGFAKGAPKAAGPIGWALMAKAGVDASGIEQDYPRLFGTENPIAKGLNWLTSPSKILGTTDQDSLTNSPFTRMMGSLGDWLVGNNALSPQNGYNPQNMFAVPSMYNPAQQTVQNNQRMTFNINVDGRKIGEYQTEVVTHNNEDVNINTEHMGD
ncbi:hypothetical protein [Salmonella phage vB_SenM_SB18]|uniref:Tape measure protein N-terminal domain-containing protein n=1 Tax=Salmonella phage vB_SenM_SB18 TaxID=2698415 RepID=A0A6B9RJ83_9CAUD|nr:hypothetical protein [Salmonella phage vB_SenM_SB18]